MSLHEKKSILDEMNDFVWQRVPLFVSEKISRRAGRLLNDGNYIAGLWNYAFLLPPVCFTLGLLVGGTHITFASEEVYTYSVLIMILMAIPSVFSACIGVWLCLGYGVGDIFIYKYSLYLHQDIPLLDFILKGLAPRLIPVIFLFLLLVSIPSAGKTLAIKMLNNLNRNNAYRRIFEPLLIGLLTAVIAYGWTKAVPLLIRPVYSWQSLSMPGESPPLYEKDWELGLVMGVCALVRQLIEQVYTENQKDSLAAINIGSANRLNQPGAPAQKSFAKIAPLLVFTVLFSTFLFSGLYSSWYDAFLFAASVLIAAVLKLMIMPRQRGWINIVRRWPLLLRLLGGVVICWLFYTYIASPNALRASEGDQQLFINSIFRNILYTILVIMVYYVFIFPDQPGPQKAKNYL